MENAMTTFVPKIKSGTTDSRRASRNALRALFTTLLTFDSCAKAIIPFKCNGSVRGHKVLDDSAAVDALVQEAPKELAVQVEAIKLTQFEKTQVLNTVLRRYFEIDKRGKLTGQPSPREKEKTAQAATVTA
jgi:hypothetical protein